MYKEGVKLDEDKIRFDLISPSLLNYVASVLRFGAAKYGDRNWELGINYNRVYRAAISHITKWWDRHNNGLDDESGLSHLAHAACCLMFLIHYEDHNETYKGFDNRPIYNPAKDDTLDTGVPSPGVLLDSYVATGGALDGLKVVQKLISSMEKPCES